MSIVTMAVTMAAREHHVTMRHLEDRAADGVISTGRISAMKR